ncbi:MAG: M13 family metallopeptidase N-terminal domain-containing protein [Acidobacteriota bacterium]
MELSRSIILALGLTVAVGPISAQNGAPRVPGIDTAGMDRSVRPQDDFFRFVNGAWADKTLIPPDRANYGTILMLRDQSQEAVRGILEAEAATPAAQGSIGQKVGDFYKSFTAAAQIEHLGVQPLSAELAAIEGLSSARDLPAAFARAARLGVGVPLSVVVGQDPQHSDVYAVLVSQAGLGMPDRDYYLRPDERFVAIRKAYTDYVARLFTLATLKDPSGAAARILAFETTLAQKQWDRAKSRRAFARDVPRVRAAHKHRCVLCRIQSAARR